MIGKFIGGFFGLVLLVLGAAYLFYLQTGFKFGLDSTIVSKGVINLSSPYFKNGGEIPVNFTCDGIDFSPDLTIDNYYFDARSLVVMMDDEDVIFKPFTHWLAFNLDPSTTNINSTKVLANAKTGVNDFGKQEYNGPCPPVGKKHTYNFKVYALDIRLDLEKPDRAEIDKAIKGHVIATGKLSGVYSKSR